MNIEPLALAHAPRIAAIHASALAGDFLPSLGVGFLTRLYEGILSLGLGFGFVAREDGLVAGFVLGSEDTSVLFRQALLRRALPMGIAMLPALLRRPSLIRNIVETFTYPAQEGAAAVTAELIVIAVDAGWRSQGVGAALCAALDAEFKARRIAAYKVTVNQSNDGANRFYLRQGFAQAHAFRLYGRVLKLYVKTL